MFEDSTFASTGKLRMRSRAGFVAATVFNSAIALALVLIPLLYPNVLPHVVSAFLMSVPPVNIEQPKPPAQTQAHLTTAALHFDPFQAPRQIPTTIFIPDKPEPPITMNPPDLADSSPFPANGPFDNGPHVTVTHGPDPQRPVRVSSLVSEGLLLDKTLPTYPPIARISRTQGTVVLQATISRAGTIENLHAISGPPMLQQAAIDAVRTWRYRPYLLNGSPVDVETTVNVVFKLNE